MSDQPQTTEAWPAGAPDWMRDEALRIDAVLTEARYMRPDRVKQLATARRSLSYLMAMYENSLFPDEGI